MKRIAVLIPFWGKTPIYFGYFLESLRGKCFDVLFFSDLDLSAFDLPSNFKYKSITFDEFRRIAKEKIDFSAEVNDCRKICDYRPLFYKMFENALAGYDYWGFGDCDVVYGRMINEVLSSLMQNDYDVISFRKNWMSGGFSLLKTSQRIRDLYLESDNWREMIKSKHMCWDECCGGEFFQDLMSSRISPIDCRKLKCDSFSALVWRTTDLHFYHEDIICESNLRGHRVYMNGDILRIDNEEIPLFHYIGAKMRRYWTYLPFAAKLGNRFLLDDTGFYYGNEFDFRCRIVHAYRKIKAFFVSMRENGLVHWAGRLRTFAARICCRHAL